MRVLTALIVDEIRESGDGQVDLLGLREDLFFDQMPVILETLSLFVEIEVLPEDKGRPHALLFRLVDEDGKPLKEAALRITIPVDHPRRVAPLDPTLFEVPFERFGPHYLDLLVDGEHSRRLFLNVLKRDPAEGA